MVNTFDTEYPLIDPTPNIPLPPPHPVQARKRIIIGCLVASLLIVLLVISTTLVLSKKSSTIHDTTTTRTTLRTQALSTTTTETITFSPKPCPIPPKNATWNKPSIAFVNRFGDCFSGEDALCRPQDLFIDDIHNTLYVADTGNNRIQKFLLTENDHSEVRPSGITVAAKNLVLPQSVFVDVRTEDMYISDFDQIDNFDLGNSASYRVHLWKKNEEVGRVLFEEAIEHSVPEYYHHITLDKEMNIYVGTRFFIEKWLASTKYTEKVIVAGEGQPNSQQSTDLFWLSTFFVSDDLTLYISDFKNNGIQRWAVNATEGTTVIGNLKDVMGITMDCNGFLYFTQWFTHTIFQLNMVTNQTRIIARLEDNSERHEFHSLSVIKIDKFGNLFLLDLYQVYKFSIIQK